MLRFCVLFVFARCPGYLMLSMTLDCLCPVSWLPNVVNDWIVFALCPGYLMLSMTLDCLCPVSWVPNVVNDFGLSLPYVLGA